MGFSEELHPHECYFVFSSYQIVYSEDPSKEQSSSKLRFLVAELKEALPTRMANDKLFPLKKGKPQIR